jgi:hypothetical protein
MCHEKCILKEIAPAKNFRIRKTPTFVITALKCILIVTVVIFSICRIKPAFAGNQREIAIFHINSYLIDCVGAGPRKCMQIRESKHDEWMSFYDSIEGFSFEVGYLYQIKVEITDVEDPPADGSSKAYKLLEIVSKKKAQPGRAKTKKE